MENTEMTTPETPATGKKEEVTIKFGKGLVGKPFMAKTGKECVGIKIPNADPADKTPWEAIVVPANRVHEDKFGKGMWMKLLADGQTKVSRSVITGQDENGKNIFETSSRVVSNRELKAMLESYKTHEQAALPVPPLRKYVHGSCSFPAWLSAHGSKQPGSWSRRCSCHSHPDR